MPGADVNYLAVLIAAIAVQPLGFLWYGKLFSARWMALRGYDATDHEGGGPGLGYALAFGLSLIEFFVLSYVVDWAFADSVLECIAIAAFMWLGFVAPVMGMAVIFSDRASFALFAIEGEGSGESPARRRPAV
jgi:hypothetical protein